MYLWWSLLCPLYLLACQVRVTIATQVFVVAFMCDIFQGLINSLVCWFCTGTLGLVLFETVSVMQFVCFHEKHICCGTEYISIGSTTSFGLEHVATRSFCGSFWPLKKVRSTIWHAQWYLSWWWSTWKKFMFVNLCCCVLLSKFMTVFIYACMWSLVSLCECYNSCMLLSKFMQVLISAALCCLVYVRGNLCCCMLLGKFMQVL